MARMLWWLSLLAFAAPTIALPQDSYARQAAAQVEARDLAAHQDDLQKRASTVFVSQAVVTVFNTVTTTNSVGSTIVSASTTSFVSASSTTVSISSTGAASQTSGSASNAGGSAAGAGASSSPSAVASDTNTGGGGGLSAGAIAGIVVGILAALVLVAVGTFYFARNRRDQEGVDGKVPSIVPGAGQPPSSTQGYVNDKMPVGTQPAGAAAQSTGAVGYPTGVQEMAGSSAGPSQPYAGPSQGVQTSIVGGAAAGAGAGVSGSTMHELPAAESSAHRATQEAQSRPWSPDQGTPVGRSELATDTEQREYK